MTSSRSGGRGPTMLICPVSTLNSCGSSSRLKRRRTLPSRGDPGVVAHLEQRAGALVEVEQVEPDLVGVLPHRAELEHAERLAVQADALGAVEDLARAAQLDQQGDDEHDRATAGRSRAPAPERVDGVLAELAGPAVLRLVDVEQREAGDRADLQARTGHVDDAGRDDEVGAGGLELPGQGPHALVAEELGVADRDHVGLRRLDGVDHGGLVAEHRDRRDPRCRGPGRRGPSRARTPRPRGSPRSGRARRPWPWPRRRGASRRRGRWRGSDAGPLVVQPGAPGLALQQQEHEADRQGDQQVAAGEVELEQVGQDRDRAEEAERGVRDPAVLLRAGADDAALPGVEQRSGPGPTARPGRPRPASS